MDEIRDTPDRILKVLKAVRLNKLPRGKYCWQVLVGNSCLSNHATKREAEAARVAVVVAAEANKHWFGEHWFEYMDAPGGFCRKYGLLGRLVSCAINTPGVSEYSPSAEILRSYGDTWVYPDSLAP